jgi:hypothetical protein
MKTCLAMLALVLVCSAAKADTITSGGLSFTCIIPSPCYTPPTGPSIGTVPQDVGTAPTSGYFIFDNTTDQFLKLTFTWDGIVLSATSFDDPSSGAVLSEPAGYLALLSGTMVWDAYCVASISAPWPTTSCDAEEFFDVHIGVEDGVFLQPRSFVSGNASTYPTDAARGLVTATDLVTTTPEPSLLVLLGIGLMGLGWRQLRNQL